MEELLPARRSDQHVAYGDDGFVKIMGVMRMLVLVMMLLMGEVGMMIIRRRQQGSNYYRLSRIVVMNGDSNDDG